MIQDESIKVVYNGDGVNTVFDYPYALDSESLIICYIYDNQYDELITAGQQFKDGTTTSVERNDKKLTVKVGNKAPTDRYDITLTRTTPTDQLTDLPNVYPYNDIEKSLDKTTLQMQELKDAQSRALKVSEDVNVDVVLPKPKPNSVYAWNDAADKLVSLVLNTTTTAEEFNRLGDDIKNLLAETTQFHDMANEQYQELLAKYSQLQATFDAMYVRSVDFNPLKELVGLGGIVAQRLEQNGYIKFANGLIIQWGVNLSRETVTFPISFTQAKYSMCAVHTGKVADVNIIINQDYNSSLTSSYFLDTFSTKIYVQWICIGK